MADHSLGKPIGWDGEQTVCLVKDLDHGAHDLPALESWVGGAMTTLLASGKLAIDLVRIF